LARAFPLTHWGRLLFSAKEAVYKAWYPLTGRWLGFKHACLTIDPAGAFAATLLIDGSRTDGKPPLTELQGRFLIAQGLVATAVTVPPNAAVECAESSAATLGADSPADISGQLIPHCLISAHDRFPGRVADPHGCPAGVSLAPGADLKL
jgi:4'-phosphopantetheinyl transferase superfamily